MSLHRIPVPLFSKHESSAGLTYLCIRLIEYHEEYNNSETTNAVSIKYLRFLILSIILTLKNQRS